jgi:hypothetical protein
VVGAQRRSDEERYERNGEREHLAAVSAKGEIGQLVPLQVHITLASMILSPRNTEMKASTHYYVDLKLQKKDGFKPIHLPGPSHQVYPPFGIRGAVSNSTIK